MNVLDNKINNTINPNERMSLLQQHKSLKNTIDNIDYSMGKKYGYQKNSGQEGKIIPARETDYWSGAATMHQRKNEHSMAAIGLLGDYLNKKKGEHHIAGTSTHEPDKNSLLHYENRKKYYD